MNIKLLLCLKDLGLPSFWLAIAEKMGPAKFIGMWKNLSGADELTPFTPPYLPKYRKFRQYKRDVYIGLLYAHGMGSKEITRKINEDLGEVISVRQTDRIIKVQRKTTLPPRRKPREFGATVIEAEVVHEYHRLFGR